MPTPVSSSPYFPGFAYDRRMRGGGQFRAPNGQTVAWRDIKAETGRFVQDSKLRMRDLGTQFLDGRIDLATWKAGMRTEIKLTQGLETVVAHGGWQNMDSRAWLEAARGCKAQYQYLEDFAADIASGKQPLNGRIVARSGMYAEAGHSTFEQTRRGMAKASGLTEECNVLGPNESHCEGPGSCLEQTARGYVPIGTLSAPGNRLCLSNCHCTLIYR